jgi:division protein CdvB (Snf7/Vps24/ESCRT-III family)
MTLYGMSDSQMENMHHLLDHIDEQLFHLSDTITEEIKDDALCGKLEKLLDKTTLLLEELREQIY